MGNIVDLDRSHRAKGLMPSEETTVKTATLSASKAMAKGDISLALRLQFKQAVVTSPSRTFLEFPPGAPSVPYEDVYILTLVPDRLINKAIRKHAATVVQREETVFEQPVAKR